MQNKLLKMMLQARNVMLHNLRNLLLVIFYFITYKLKYITINYRKDLYMFKNYHWTK